MFGTNEAEPDEKKILPAGVLPKDVVPLDSVHFRAETLNPEKPLFLALNFRLEAFSRYF